MNEGTIKSNGSCTHAQENDHDHEHEHEHEHGIQHDHDPDLDLNGNSKGKETLTMSAAKVNPGEHAEVWLPDDSRVCSQDSNHFTCNEHVDDSVGNHSKAAEVENSNKLDNPSSSPIEASSSPIQTKPPGTTPKGYGLKKWRRFRREVPKDAMTSLDSIKVLKRGPANVVDVKQPSDASASSTNAIVQSPVGADDLGIPGSSSSYNLPVNTIFSAGADTDTSEDRSSKSSTAASAPKYRHDAIRALGHQRDKHRAKNVGGRNLGAGGPRSQAGKAPGVADTSKKPRGEGVKIEKENSLSSMESDSRSYNSVFVRSTPSVIGDQSQCGRPINHDHDHAHAHDHDVEDADDEPASEEQSAEELRADCGKNISVSQESSSDANQGKSENHQLPKNCDPLVNSILMLQSAHAALEKVFPRYSDKGQAFENAFEKFLKLQQFGEIGRGIHSLCEDLGENTDSPAYSVSRPEVCMDNTSDGWGSESNHEYFNKNVQTLGRQLGETEGRLKEKELKVAELEATIKTMESPLEDVERAIQQQQKRCEEMEAELESLFKQKVEAEVEFVAMTRSTKELSSLVENHFKLLKEQKSLARELAQSSRTVAEVENKAAVLQDRLREVDTLYKESTGSEEIVKMQKRLLKFTKCLFIQLILLLLVFGVFFSQLSVPKSAMVVPT
ncbi:hypothetical protein Cgig2_016236 [Carnegiea gigantea]|uniref:Uncharacterized protein n=1 Tax=Carnegiea gigantea TaxID=171969 RepID=A0A9Q1GLP3_9CARY|nr:hypothetical protein Cgig2_016236 [Carnegiea gigantea]